MPKNSNQKLKCLYVLEILKTYSDEEHPLNAADIVKHLESRGITAERKSVYSDILNLEDFGYDIIKTDSPKVGWFMGEREFEVPEIYLLSDAVRSAKFISPKKTGTLLSKLNSMLSINQGRRQKTVFFSLKEKSGNEEIYYNIDKISSAIEDKRQIKVKYLHRRLDKSRDVRESVTEMTFNPYALCWQDDYYYLIGNYQKYDNLIHLRLDRIRSVDILETKARPFSEVCDYAESFDTGDYVSRLFGMYTGVPDRVEFRCKKKISEQIFDRFGEDIFITDVTEEDFKFKADLIVSEALVTWIINYGADIKVLSPRSLIDTVRERAQQVLNNYSE